MEIDPCQYGKHDPKPPYWLLYLVLTIFAALMLLALL